jgi:hypothetical protein
MMSFAHKKYSESAVWADCDSVVGGGSNRLTTKTDTPESENLKASESIEGLNESKRIEVEGWVHSFEMCSPRCYVRRWS